MDITKLKADFSKARRRVEKGNIGQRGWTFNIQLYRRQHFNWRYELGYLLYSYIEHAPLKNPSHQFLYGFLRRHGFEWDGQFWQHETRENRP